MRFALNARDWTEHLLHYNPPEVTPFTLIRTVPITGFRAKIQTLKECRAGYTQMIPEEAGIGVHVLFHPLDVILRLLLEESPSSTLAYIEDDIWCSVVKKSEASLSSIVDFLIQILETHELLVQEDVVTLKPSKTESQQHARPTVLSVLTRLPTYIHGKYRSAIQHKKNLNRLAKVKSS